MPSMLSTGAKLRGREDITIATWNLRILKTLCQLEELLYEIDRYKWNVLGLCEMRSKNSGEILTDDVFQWKRGHT